MAPEAAPLPLWRRLAWLVAIWTLGVAAVGAVSMVIHLCIRP